MEQYELLRYIVKAFEELDIDYMIGGSQASIYYGEPRLTNDIETVDFSQLNGNKDCTLTNEICHNLHIAPQNGEFDTR